MNKIDIQVGDNLPRIEQAITSINAAPAGSEFTIRLARKLNAHFFKQSRIAALFATAKQKGCVNLRDWHHTWSPADIDGVFRSSVGHFAAALNSGAISNEHGTKPPFTGGEVAATVANNCGILEPHSSAKREITGASLSFCSIDPAFSEPLALAGLIYDKKRFVDELTSIKRRDLDLEPSHATLDIFGDDSPDRELAAYVFELYQNGYEHGNRSRADKKEVIPGLRFISLRKHIGANFDQLRLYADGFTELGQYVETCYNDSRTLKYYEVSVSDQGLGMLDRFLIDRPEWVAEARDYGTRLNLLKRLLTENLTSKRGAPGAGGGLIRALRAAKELKGFVSVRTAEFWLFYSFVGSNSAQFEVSEVRSAAPSAIVGTHFNALFPLRR